MSSRQAMKHLVNGTLRQSNCELIQAVQSDRFCSDRINILIPSFSYFEHHESVNDTQDKQNATKILGNDSLVIQLPFCVNAVGELTKTITP